MPIKLAPRLDGFDYLGFYRYFLTICTAERPRIFVDDEAVGLVIVQLTRTAGDQGFSVIAYCLMPDHIHLLVEGTHPAADFREFVRLFKQRSSFHWKQRNGVALWQVSGIDDHDNQEPAVLRPDLKADLKVRLYVPRPGLGTGSWVVPVRVEPVHHPSTHEPEPENRTRAPVHRSTREPDYRAVAIVAAVTGSPGS